MSASGYRLCPNCGTARPLTESCCEGTIDDGSYCFWDLTGVRIESQPQATPHALESTPELSETSRGMPTPWAPAPLACPQGHAVTPGDLMCVECGADLVEVSPIATGAGSNVAEGSAPAAACAPEEAIATVIDGWRLEKRLGAEQGVLECFLAIRESDERRGVVTLYAEGSEPDPAVHEVLRHLDHDHIPELIQTGRAGHQAFEVWEEITGGSLADLQVPADPLPTFMRITDEMARALSSFAECGLRHRNLHPGNVLVRTLEPLDLVITGFGCARLSDLDLDIESPLETTRYMAPETIMGGVSPASDWWSLGMMLLERVTGGECFGEASPSLFLIHVLTNGVPVRDTIEPRTRNLLQGLLTRDRNRRWRWNEVRAWLDGETVPVHETQADEAQARASISLGGKDFRNPRAFALEAARQANWNEALHKLQRGAIGTWAEEAGLDATTVSALRRIVHDTLVPDDFRLAIALEVLNPALPLIVREVIINPGWLLEHPSEGYELITGPVPTLIDHLGLESEEWLVRLSRRASTIRERAAALEIDLDEEAVQVHVLSTSRARLTALWEERRRLLPDTEHSGLASLLAHSHITDEDLVVLVSAHPSQFRARDDILAEAVALARGVGLTREIDVAAPLSELPRRELYAELDKRIESFSRCGHETLDAWADEYRLTRRIPLERTLVLLAVPPPRWQKPPHQEFMAKLLGFFEQKVAGAILRGPLVQMRIGKATPRIDMTELDADAHGAQALLEGLLQRTDRTHAVEPTVFGREVTLEARFRNLVNRTSIFYRDTGINGLYLGFPFLLWSDRPGRKPRLAPVLLWPVRVNAAVGTRGRVSVGFDRDREEVRLNPALEGLLGPDEAASWREAADSVLGRSSVRVADVMDGFGILAPPRARHLVPLPDKNADLPCGTRALVCASVLFHVEFLGQAIVEDLRHLKSVPPAGSALECMLRVGGASPPSNPAPETAEIDRYLLAASDPSQEEAIARAWVEPGLLVQGPPGTGKSQTIVNLVADAIGRGRSLLIVCQKLPALDVVRKRLVAEGLGGRLTMVTNVTRDRRPILQAIRDQLEALRHRDSPGWAVSEAAQPQRKRKNLADRIGMLESQLDQHHGALFRVDELSGKTYREILGDLLTLEEAGPCGPEFPALARFLACQDPALVHTLEDECGALVLDWLPAHFESSPLVALGEFPGEPAEVAEFNLHFDALLACEAERAALPAGKLSVETPEPLEQWLAAHGGPLERIPPPTLRDLVAWLPKFRDASAPGHRWMGDVDHLLARLGPLGVDPADAALLEQLIPLPDAELHAWLPRLQLATAATGFWQSLNPARWLARRSATAFLVERGRPTDNAGLAAFLRVARIERDLRPVRRDLSALLGEVGRPPGDDPLTMPPRRLEAMMRDLLEALGETQRHAAIIAVCPLRAEAEQAVSRGTLESILALTVALEQAVARSRARLRSLETLKGLAQWMTPAWMTRCRKAIAAGRLTGTCIDPIARSRSTIGAYQRFRVRVKSLHPAALEVFATLAEQRLHFESLPGAALPDTVRQIVRRHACLGWKNRLEERDPWLLAGRDELASRVDSLAKADRDMRLLNREYLASHVERSRLADGSRWESITRLQGPRAVRLREFFDRGIQLGLLTLRPVWLMIPEVASQLVPRLRGMFDMVVYDEASQMPVEVALPTLYRARLSVVSGDDKQMPPTTFFASRIESDEADVVDYDEVAEDLPEAQRDQLEEAWNRREIKDCPDLLHLAMTTLPHSTLQVHYRSAYRGLIAFSNAAFYRNQLSVPAHHPDAEVRRVQPIELIPVHGVYRDQTNQEEAEHVVDYVARLWGGVKAPPTVGVVTFNRKQADLIEEVLEARAEVDADFAQALAREREREEDGEDMGMFVKNVENVQGDERDVIVFSTTFGRNPQGQFRRNFGVLGQRGGERRLNVAVSRARQRVVLITSMPIPDISDFLATRREPATPRDYLQAYLEYARLMSEGSFDAARQLLSRFTSGGRAPSPNSTPVDGLARSVEGFLREMGHEPVAVGNDPTLGIDYAIVDPRTGLFGIGIECDAPRHPLVRRARAREIWRPAVLARAYPVVHRISARAWYHDGGQERSRLRAALQKALGSRP